MRRAAAVHCSHRRSQSVPVACSVRCPCTLESHASGARRKEQLSAQSCKFLTPNIVTVPPSSDQTVLGTTGVRGRSERQGDSRWFWQCFRMAFRACDRAAVPRAGSRRGTGRHRPRKAGRHGDAHRQAAARGAAAAQHRRQLARQPERQVGCVCFNGHVSVGPDFQALCASVKRSVLTVNCSLEHCAAGLSGWFHSDCHCAVG